MQVAAICTPIYSTPEKVDNSPTLTTKNKRKLLGRALLPIKLLGKMVHLAAICDISPVLAARMRPTRPGRARRLAEKIGEDLARQLFQKVVVNHLRHFVEHDVFVPERDNIIVRGDV